MSWFVGIAGHNQSLKEEIKVLADVPPLLEVEFESLYLVGGRLESTTQYSLNPEQQKGWLASGIGISQTENPRLMKANDWEKALSQGKVFLHQLNGHFAVVQWDGDRLECTTDQLGMRNIFLHEGDGFTLFSTRLDWLMKLVPEANINWERFGSRWLAINQFSSQSFMDGIERLSQGGHAVIQSGMIKEISNRRWNADFAESEPDVFKQSLFNFTSLPLKENRKLSLGLSGGMDSRTLFASLLQASEEDWRLHTFGDPDHPDLHTAAQLNQPFGRAQHIFHEAIPPAEKLETLIPDFIGQTLFTSSPSHLVGFQAYQKICNLNLAVVDGGFGEIARRRFMVSVMLRAKKAVLEKDAGALMPYVSLSRGDFFEEEVHRQMHRGFREELQQELDAMPDAEGIGLENWLDLFSIRTRVPNGAGPEQARSDAQLFNYMPFLQPQLIRQALGLPLSYRNNARLFREIIRENAPELQKTPLVKGDVSYPYWMGDLSSAVWMRIKRKLGMQYQSTRQADFLFEIEEYVRDLAESQSTREYPAYNQQKVQQLVSGFYDEKNTSLAGELNWWLAFEVFRRVEE